MIERQTAELVFRFNGTERNGNVTVFMPPTVHVDCIMVGRCLTLAKSTHYIPYKYMYVILPFFLMIVV